MVKPSSTLLLGNNIYLVSGYHPTGFLLISRKGRKERRERGRLVASSAIERSDSYGLNPVTKVSILSNGTAGNVCFLR